MVIQTLNPLCPCSVETETKTHYFLCCHFYKCRHVCSYDDLNEIDSSFSTLNDEFTDLILHGSDKFDDKKNPNILMYTIELIKDSQRLDKHLLNFWIKLYFGCEY